MHQNYVYAIIWFVTIWKIRRIFHKLGQCLVFWMIAIATFFTYKGCVTFMKPTKI